MSWLAVIHFNRALYADILERATERENDTVKVMAIINIVNLRNPDPCINWQPIDDNYVYLMLTHHLCNSKNYYFKPI